MTRTFRTDRQRPRNAFDRFYHSFSAEFWLITASAIIIFDWCLHPSSSTAAFLMLATVSLGGFALCSTNPRIGRTARRMQTRQKWRMADVCWLTGRHYGL